VLCAGAFLLIAQELDMVHNPDVLALLQRAQRACEDMAAIHATLTITRAETQRLLDLARQNARTNSVNSSDTIGVTSTAEPRDPDPYVLAMDALHLIRDILSDFPLEWQVHVVKALTAQTMLMVSAQTRPTLLTPTA